MDICYNYHSTLYKITTWLHQRRRPGFKARHYFAPQRTRGKPSPDVSVTQTLEQRKPAHGTIFKIIQKGYIVERSPAFPLQAPSSSHMQLLLMVLPKSFQTSFKPVVFSVTSASRNSITWELAGNRSSPAPPQT